MVIMASTSFNGTQNSSALNLSNIDQIKQYRQCIVKFSQLDNEAPDHETRVESTSAVVQQVKDLGSSSFTNTTGALMDSYVLRQAGQQALTAVASIEVNTNVYSAAELANHVLENPAFWQFALPRRVASAGALHGAFQLQAPPPPAPRARRKPAAQRQAAATRVPDNIAAMEKPNEDTAMVSRVRSCVKRACRRGALSYWHAVLDPSFERTVHNVYYVSFLVRDGLLDVYIDEQHGIPMVRPLATAHRPDRDISKENQFIVSLDMARWQELLEVCGITEPMLKLE